MPQIQRIVSYICMFQVIFQHFGTLAAKVSINQNITGILGSNDTYLTCSFFLEKGEQIVSVQLIAKNITEDFVDKPPIAIFKPQKAAKLLQSGMHLSKRVTLTNITNKSTNATLTFRRLEYKDEQNYKCLFFYFQQDDMDKIIARRESEVTRISVKVQVRDVYIKNEPSQKQYDERTDNITLTCKASGNPEPKYIWFKEENNSSILSRTNRFVIEDVIQNNSGVYICHAYNTIDNINYRHSNSVKIDIVDELMSSSESVSSKIYAASYSVPIIIVVGLIVIFLAVIYRKYCSKQAQTEKNKESSWQNKIACFSSCDSCTKKPDYTPVLRNNTNTVAPTDDSKGLKENKVSCRNKEVDLVNTVAVIQIIPTASSNEYANPKDILPSGIVKDRGKNEDNGASDESAVYAEVIDPANTKYEISKNQTLVTSETVDHNNIPEDHCYV